MIKTFRDLLVWQKAHQLVLDIYKATAKFPNEEKYELYQANYGGRAHPYRQILPKASKEKQPKTGFIFIIFPTDLWKKLNINYCLPWI
jgi:hypothetical protein